MSKHTAGPWATDEHTHDVPYLSITIVSASNRRIATIWIDDAPVEDYNREQRANARLIAAAPDLLAALVELLSEAEEGIATCPLTRDKARSAIAKAKGGA